MAISDLQAAALDSLYDHMPELGKGAGVENPLLGTALQAVQDVAEGFVPGEAGLIGIADIATIYTATTVEDALAEVKVIADAAMPTATLALTTNGNGASLVGLEDAGTLFTATTVEAALAEVKTLADASTAAALTKRTVTVGHADLTDAVNGEAQAINIGAALPANARIAYAEMRALAPFTGGSASAVTVDIGTSGDVDAIVAAADVHSAAVDSGPATMPPGVRPNKMFTTIGAQLIATFTPDGGHTLDGLTAGSVIIDVFYFVGA